MARVLLLGSAALTRARQDPALGDNVVRIAVPPWGPPEGARWKETTDYVDDQTYGAVELEAVGWLRAIARKPVLDGKSVVDLLQEGPTSLWWSIDAHFHRHEVKHAARNVAWLLSAIEEESATELAFADDGGLFARTAHAVAAARGLQAHAMPASAPVKQPVPRAEREIRGPALWVRDALRRWRNPRRPPAARPGPALRVLVASMPREQVTADPASGRVVTQDLMLAPVLEALAAEPDIAATYLYKFPYPRRIVVPEGPARSLGVCTWEGFLDRAARRCIRDRVRELDGLRMRLWASPAFRAAWGFRGVDLWPVLESALAARWSWELRMALRFSHLAEAVLERERPDVVVIASETSLDNKALIVSARRRGIPVVAVQHGSVAAIDDFLVDMGATPEDLAGEPSKRWQFPDAVCISGEETLRTMVEGIGYPFPERLVVTGQPRMDMLLRAAEKYDRNRFCKAFGIDATKPIVLVGSQTFHMAGNREAFMRGIHQALGAESELSLVVKPHPMEDEAWHRRFITSRRSSAVLLPRNSNMQEALFACDVMLTFYSTIAVEAMILGRPVVTVNLTGRPDVFPYAAKGAALGVYAPQDILPAVRAALDDTGTRRRLAEGAAAFVERELRGQDGAATRRVIGQVRAAVRNRESLLSRGGQLPAAQVVQAEVRPRRGP